MSARMVTNARAMGRAMQARARRTDTAMHRAHVTWGRAVKAKAVQMSQGPLSTEFLETFKPGLYSLRRAANPAFDAIINRQTGQFAAAWEVQHERTGPESRVSVVNTSEHAKEMSRNIFMRERPIVQFAIEESPSRIGFLLEAKRAAERS